MIAVGLLGAFDQLLDLGRRRLLGFDGGVDLVGVVFAIGVSCRLLLLPVVLYLGLEADAAELVLDGGLQVVDRHFIPDLVDDGQLAPLGRDVLEVADEAIDVVLLGGLEDAEVDVLVDGVPGELVLDELEVALVQLLIEAVRDRVVR